MMTIQEALKEFAEEIKNKDFSHCIEVIYSPDESVKRVELKQSLFNKCIDDLLKSKIKKEGEINETV